MKAIEQGWQSRGLIAWLLLPLSIVYSSLLSVRQWAYATGLKKTGSVHLPVVVVGNLSVGGTGKTPLCLHLIEHFQQAGWRPAIVSRGYGGPRQEQPYLLSDADTSDTAADEPMMLHQQTGVPVCVCIDRTAAVQHIAANTDATIVFADDGLQHLAMPRAAQILVIDGVRGFGNRWVIPAGPLRSSLRLAGRFDVVAIQVPPLGSGPKDPIVLEPVPREHLHESIRHSSVQQLIEQSEDCQFTLVPTHLIELASGRRHEIAGFVGQQVHGVAGIGNPQRFFNSLNALGMHVEAHPMVDHHRFRYEDVSFDDGKPVLVTSKDAVKLMSFTQPLDNVFEVCVQVRSTHALSSAIVALEKKLRDSVIIGDAHNSSENIPQ